MGVIRVSGEHCDKIKVLIQYTHIALFLPCLIFDNDNTVRSMPNRFNAPTKRE